MSIFEENKADQPNEEPKGEQEQAPKEETPQEQETATPQREDSPFDTMLQGITNSEGKPKYSNVEDALKSIPHAQTHIKTLETENQSLKDEINTLKEQVEEYKSQVERFQSVEELMNDKNETKGLTPEELDQYLEQKLAQREQQKTAAQNTTSVANSLVEMFGDKDTAEREFLKLQDELGIDLVNLSAQSPKAVLRYFKQQKTEKAPDKFNGKPAGEFNREEKPKQARMPRTTAEAVSNWRESVENTKNKLGIE